MIFWILFSIFVTLIWAFGSMGGYSVGYRRGVQETIKIQDAAYRSRLAADTQTAKEREEVYTTEVKKRVTHQIEELKRCGLGAVVLAPPQDASPQEAPTQVKTESGKVIEFPGGAANLPDKPVA